MIGKYNRIEYVKYNDGRFSYIISGDNIDKSFEVDIKDNFCFNTEFDIVDRVTVKTIRNTLDIVNFTKKHLGIDMYFNNYHSIEKYVLVGAERDCIVCCNLEFDWLEQNLPQELLAEQLWIKNKHRGLFPICQIEELLQKNNLKLKEGKTISDIQLAVGRGLKGAMGKSELAIKQIAEEIDKICTIARWDFAVSKYNIK